MTILEDITVKSYGTDCIIYRQSVLVYVESIEMYQIFRYEYYSAWNPLKRFCEYQFNNLEEAKKQFRILTREYRGCDIIDHKVNGEL